MDPQHHPTMDVLAATATPASHWRVMHEQCLGRRADPRWLIGLGVEELEVSMTADRILVVMDRAPMGGPNGGNTAGWRAIHATPGTRLVRVGEVQQLSDTILYGAYRGELGGAHVFVERYVKERNGVLLALVLVVTRMRPAGSLVDHVHREKAMALLKDVGGANVG